MSALLDIHDITSTEKELANMLNVKGKWQQKLNSSDLKEIQKQCLEVYYIIFISACFTLGDILT